MIALKIPGGEVKTMMHHLLKAETFDAFELREVAVRSFIRFDANGLLYEEKQEEENTGERRKYALWCDVRPYIFGLIKGGTRPRLMKFVFSLPNEKAKALTPLASVLFLNITFENNEILITTGLQTKEFSLDKGPEQAWDDAVRRFFRGHKIAAEEIA
jgi:hypothetical protein